jgi:hypothetical protein
MQDTHSTSMQEADSAEYEFDWTPRRLPTLVHDITNAKWRGRSIAIDLFTPPLARKGSRNPEAVDDGTLSLIKFGADQGPQFRCPLSV